MSPVRTRLPAPTRPAPGARRLLQAGCGSARRRTPPESMEKTPPRSGDRNLAGFPGVQLSQGGPMRLAARILLGPGAFLAASLSVAQAPWPTPVPSMTVEEYEPKSTLVVPGHEIRRAKYPFIDVHNHQDTDLS